MPKKSPPPRGPYLRELQLLRDRVPSFDRFPYSLPAVRHLDRLAFHPQVTFLVGENGTGKSTLLEALAVGCDLNPEGGSRHFHFATRKSHADMSACLRLSWEPVRPRDSYFLRAESFYNVATEVERLDKKPRRGPAGHGAPVRDAYGPRNLHEQSHGESFFALFEHRFRGNGLYLLDEPESALSPRRQLEFLALLHRDCKLGGQFVIATHSPLLMAYPAATIYVLGPDGLRVVPYQETEHYLITRGFLANPGRTLQHLLSDDAPAP